MCANKLALKSAERTLPTQTLSRIRADAICKLEVWAKAMKMTCEAELQAKAVERNVQAN